MSGRKRRPSDDKVRRTATRCGGAILRSRLEPPACQQPQFRLFIRFDAQAIRKRLESVAVATCDDDDEERCVTPGPVSTSQAFDDANDGILGGLAELGAPKPKDSCINRALVIGNQRSRAVLHGARPDNASLPNTLFKG
jgi:hypothetical protein